MRQFVYVSTANWFMTEDELSTILGQSIHANVLNAVTGVLWSDSRSFIQIVEGLKASVDETCDRILLDDCHRDLRSSISGRCGAESLVIGRYVIGARTKQTRNMAIRYSDCWVRVSTPLGAPWRPSLSQISAWREMRFESADDHLPCLQMNAEGEREASRTLCITAMIQGVLAHFGAEAMLFTARQMNLSPERGTTARTWTDIVTAFTGQVCASLIGCLKLTAWVGR